MKDYSWGILILPPHLFKKKHIFFLQIPLLIKLFKGIFLPPNVGRRNMRTWSKVFFNLFH